MILEGDLELIWDTEYSDDYWEVTALKEFTIGYFFYYDVYKCHKPCGRYKNHKGPCFECRMEFVQKSLTDKIKFTFIPHIVRKLTLT